MSESETPAARRRRILNNIRAVVEEELPRDTSLSDLSLGITALHTVVLMRCFPRGGEEVEEAFLASMFLAVISLRLCTLAELDPRSELAGHVWPAVSMVFLRATGDLRGMSTAGQQLGGTMVARSEESAALSKWVETLFQAVDAVALLGNDVGLAALPKLFGVMPIPSVSDDE